MTFEKQFNDETEQLTDMMVKLSAFFSNNVYYVEDVRYDKRPKLPEGWEYLMDCPPELRQYGYYGQAYKKVDPKTNTVEIYIAHRGTDNFFGAIEDSELWLMNIVPFQFTGGAKPFVERVLNTLEAEYPRSMGWVWDLHDTGHSLGSTLSQLVATNFGLLYQMQGLSFDSPGSQYLIDKLKEECLLTQAQLDYAKKHTRVINSKPDAINTVSPPLYPPFGSVPIDVNYPRIGILPFAPGYLDYIYTSFFDFHSMLKINAWIQEHDYKTMPLLTGKWPEGIINGYEYYKTYKNDEVYWNGYMQQLWDNNGIESTLLQIVFSENFEEFKAFYIDNVLYSTNKRDMRQEVQFPHQKELAVLWDKNPRLQKEFHDLSSFALHYYSFFNSLRKPHLKETELRSHLLWEKNGIDSYILHLVFADNEEEFKKFYATNKIYPTAQTPSPMVLSHLMTAETVWEADKAKDKKLQIYFGTEENFKDYYNRFLCNNKQKPPSPPLPVSAANSVQNEEHEILNSTYAQIIKVLTKYIDSRAKGQELNWTSSRFRDSILTTTKIGLANDLLEKIVQSQKSNGSYEDLLELLNDYGKNNSAVEVASEKKYSFFNQSSFSKTLAEIKDILIEAEKSSIKFTRNS